MPERYLNKYRIPSARLSTWNYGSPGFYFITICTAHRKHFFGEIVDGRMHLSDIGLTVETEWLKTPELRPDMKIDLGEFVVMPNHFHAILMIGQNSNNLEESVVFPKPNSFGPQKKNLASIIRGFKSAVTTYARKKGIPFAWQSRFYDHIIRDTASLERIAQYIQNNPANWIEDCFFVHDGSL